MALSTSELIPQLKNALTHLHEPDLLSLNLLAQRFHEFSDPLERGAQLQFILLELIESFKPNTPFSIQTPEWRRYLLLHERFVQRRSFWDIEVKLALGDRQVRREQQRALNVLAARFQARFRDPGQTDESAPEVLTTGASAGVATSLKEAIQRLIPIPSVFSLNQLFEEVDILLTTAKYVQKGSIYWHIQPPDQTVYTDRGILNQLLLKLVQLFANSKADSGGIRLDAYCTCEQVFIIISRTGPGTIPDNEEMQLCRWLAESLCTNLVITFGDLPAAQFKLTAGTRLRRLFIIDDEPPAIELLRGYLTGLDYEVHDETNPELALQHVVDIRPDVIVLDVMMPGVDGWSVLQRLRLLTDLRHVPIIVYSVLDEADLAEALGATRFIRKPVLRQQWISILEDLCK